MEIDGRPTERGSFQLPEGAGEMKIIVRIGGNGGQPAPGNPSETTEARPVAPVVR